MTREVEVEANAGPGDGGGACCARCGYDLRGSDVGGRCPECGLAVGLSLAPAGDLRAGPPGWLKALAWGAGLAAGAMGALLLYMPVSGGMGAWPYQFSVLSLLSGVFVAGTWLMTRRRRRPGAGTMPLRDGFVLRWGVRVVGLCLVASQAMTHLTLYTGEMRYVQAGTALAMPVALLPLLLGWHARRLARGLHRSSIAEHAGVVAVGLTTTIVMSVGIDLAAEWHWFRGGRAPAATLVGGVLIVLFFLWAAVTLARLTVALRRAWKESAAAWGAAG